MIFQILLNEQTLTDGPVDVFIRLIQGEVRLLTFRGGSLQHLVDLLVTRFN